MSRSNAPLDRSIIDNAQPILRVLLALAFIGFSGASTVRISADDMSTYFHLGETITLYLVEDRFWYGIILALVVLIGELATSTHHKKPYLAFLAIDVFYTARGVYRGIYNIFEAALGKEPAAMVAAVLLAFLVSTVIGAVIAYYGEIMLFGPRKSTRSKSE